MKSWISFSLLLLLSSCGGYHWQPEDIDGQRPTVTVPFIEKDEDGLLTAEIVRALSASGIADVVSKGGEYELQVAILEESNDKIGFRIDPQKVDGEVRQNLLAVEGRRNLTAEVSLCHPGGEIAQGPYRLTADAEYDYVDGDSLQDLTFVNSQGQVLTVLPFSLGQLESTESAQLAATHPLYRKLAQKIVDAISSRW